MLEDTWQFLGDDNTGALEAFDRAINLNPHDAIAWNNRSIALTKLGGREQALEASDRGTNVNPDDADA